MPEDQPFLPYPHIPEAAATGTVAAVYEQVRGRFGFVPHLFTSLALFPPYLTIAWEQASSVVGTGEFLGSAAELVQSAVGRVPPPDDSRVRTILGGRASGRMLLLSTGLALGLRGDLPGHSAAGVRPVPVTHSPRAPTARLTDPAFGTIRRDLDTPVVNELWHLLADDDLLGRAWQGLRPHAAAAREAAPDVVRAAEDAARALPWTAVADPSAIERVGCAEVSPGVALVLEAFSVTLARVLVLVSACREQPDGKPARTRGGH